MKKIILLTLLISMLVTVLCSCCFHKASADATCTEPKLCDKCGEIMEEAKGHTKNGEPTCTQDSVCTVCQAVLTPALGHTMPETYSCTDGADCTVCQTELVAPAEHVPNNPACLEETVCTVCNTKIADAKGHTPDGDADCVKPSTCTVCKEILVEAKGHTPGAEATETTDQICTTCNTILVPKKNSGTNIVGTYIEETVSGGHYQAGDKSFYNGSKTVLGYGNYMMEYFGAKAAGNSGYAKILSDFAAKYPNVSVNSIIVPKCASFHSPADRTDQFETHKSYINSTYAMMNGVKTIDAFGEMAKHRDEYLFYRTDHHWTSLGAYYASVAFCNANGITARDITSYKKVVNTGFWGTLYTTYWGTSVKKPDVWTDYTVGHLPAASYDFKFSYLAGATTGTNNGTAIKESAKTYASMFICGDVPFIDIKTSVANGKKVIVFKESYGNAFVPYLIDYFEEVIVIDMRYSTASVKGIIEKYGITDAIVINNIQASSGMQSQLKARLVS